MKSKLIIALVAVLAVAGLIGYYSTRTTSKNANTNSTTSQDTVQADGTIVKADGTMMKPDGTIVKADGTMIKPDGTMIGPDGVIIKADTNSSVNTNVAPTSEASAATYVDYSAAAYSRARATGEKTVLYFHAPWCPVCRQLEPSIRANLDTLPKGLTILKVDYDSSTDLKKQFGVTYQHTFVQVDANGNKLKLWSGSVDASAIADEVI